MHNETYLIIPVFNRVQTTLACLGNLQDAKVFDWAHAVVVDDASPDGTADLVRAAYSAEQVTVLDGTGNLWWSGGTNLGMQYALNHGAQYVFWLNDDCRPRDGTLMRMLNHAREHGEIAVALSITPSGYQYGGFKKTRLGLKKVDSGSCDAFGGNCVCIPTEVLNHIGLIDASHFPMDPGDADFGLRARRAGFRAVLVDGALCDNDDNLTDAQKSWLFSDVPLQYFSKCYFINQYHSRYIPTCFRFRYQHWGILGFIYALFFYAKFTLFALVRLIIPKRVLSRLSRHSISREREAYYQ